MLKPSARVLAGLFLVAVLGACADQGAEAPATPATPPSSYTAEESRTHGYEYSLNDEVVDEDYRDFKGVYRNSDDPALAYCYATNWQSRRDGDDPDAWHEGCMQGYKEHIDRIVRQNPGLPPRPTYASN